MSLLRPVCLKAARSLSKYYLEVSRTAPVGGVINSHQKVQTTNFTHSIRNYCKNMADKIVTYEEVVTYKDNSNVLLIDVREPNELQETGTIPSSINIPLGTLSDALKNPKEFKSKYGREFPEKDANLVFSCKLGGRAAKAMDAATALGYVNSKYYKGSWTDWASKQK